MATHKHHSKKHSKTHSKKHSKSAKHSSHHSMTQKASHGHTDCYCPTCKKQVNLKESKVVEFKVNGHTRKRIAGVGVCGHKVSKFLKNNE